MKSPKEAGGPRWPRVAARLAATLRPHTLTWTETLEEVGQRKLEI